MFGLLKKAVQNRKDLKFTHKLYPIKIFDIADV